jgi:hypothetical protein
MHELKKIGGELKGNPRIKERGIEISTHQLKDLSEESDN